VLVEGHTRIVGTARDLAADPQIAALYLGHHRGIA
jgi:branched-chain amino acid transport system ATP-binding protein